MENVRAVCALCSSHKLRQKSRLMGSLVKSCLLLYPYVSQWRRFCLPGDVWQCLERFLVVTTACGGMRLPPSGWKPRMLLNIFRAWDFPTPQRRRIQPPIPASTYLPNDFCRPSSGLSGQATWSLGPWFLRNAESGLDVHWLCPFSLGELGKVADLWKP